MITKRVSSTTAAAGARVKRLLKPRTLDDKRRYAVLFLLTACILTAVASLRSDSVSAQTTFPDPNAACPRAVCGEVSPFIPMQSAEAVHMGLVWKRSSDTPKILFHSRFPEYKPNDMADPALIDLAIARGALTTAGNQFNTSLRDVLHGFDPFLGLGTARNADDSFQRLTYGGYLMRQGLSQSVPTRILANSCFSTSGTPMRFGITANSTLHCSTRTTSPSTGPHSRKTVIRRACSTTLTATPA
jgi:hypothetical protein